MLDVKQLARECDRLEEFYRQRHLPGEPGIQLFLYRSCRGQTARLLPGRPALHGEIVYWGSGDDASVVIVKVAAVRAWLKGLFDHVADGLEEALLNCDMRLPADKVGGALKSVLQQAGSLPHDGDDEDGREAGDDRDDAET